MKKIVLSAILLAGTAFTSVAQVNPNAIGVRLTSNFSNFGAEVSYQRGFGDNNRLELDLGADISNSVYSLVGAFHWDYNLVAGLNWFVGPAVQFVTIGPLDGNLFGIGGQVGLEYDFNTNDIPFLLSLDTRPMYFLNLGFGGNQVALGARYTF